MRRSIQSSCIRNILFPGLLMLGLLFLATFTSSVCAQVNPAPPNNDQCFSTETIPSSGPFPYLSMVTDVRDATTAGDPPVPMEILESGGEPSRSIWYVFTPSQTAFYTLSTCRDAPTDTTLIDNFMAIYTSEGGCAGPFSILQDSATTRGFADESCGPGYHQAAITTTLQAGTTYYIVVWQFDSAVPPPANTWVQMRVNKVEPPLNDTCDNAIGLSLDMPLSGPVATSIGSQNSYQLPDDPSLFKGIGHSPSIGAGGDVVYTFTAPESGLYSFSVRQSYSEGSNLVLYVAASCPESGPFPRTVTSCIAASHRNLAGSSEEIYGVALTNGQQVYLFVDEDSPSIGRSFIVEVNKCVVEAEPNNTPLTASELACGITGAISNTPSADLDFFALGTWPAGYRAFAMLDATTAKSPNFDLRITSITNVLQFDDQSNDILFGDTAPNIAGTVLTGNPAYVRVNYTAQSVEPYKLYTVVQPPLASATPEVEPNNTVANANSSPINYFYGTLAGPTPSSDVDMYVFNASEGDLVFLSLDGDPLRNNTPIDAKLELLDSQGSVLIGVDNHGYLSSTSAGATLGSSTPYSPSEALVYRLVSEGAYIVRVTLSPDASLSAGAGDYLLSISRNCFAGDRNSSLPPEIVTVTKVPPVGENGSASLSVDFKDADMAESHTVVIDWGDGTIQTSTNLAAGITNFSSSHSYVDNAPNPANDYSVSVTVVDRYQTSTTTNFPLRVLNVAPAGIALSVSAPAINENDTVTISGSFNDPGTLDTHTVSIAWADGSPAFTTNLASGQFEFSASHRYLNNKAGGYLVNVTVQDKDGGAASSTTNITVNNLPPSLSNVAVTSPITVGSSATLTGNLADAGTLDAHVLTVSWGDGSANTVTNIPAGATSFSLVHSYSTAGTNRMINLTLTDDGVTPATASTTITVQQPAQPHFESITRLPNGHIRVLLQGGTPGVPYRIQSSSTLLPGSWSVLATQAADGSGDITYEDPTTPLQPVRHYRAVWP